jgi:NADH dehydrogenase
MRAAHVLQRANARVTVIDRTNHHLFQPLLYEVATGFLAPSDIAIPIRAELGARKNLEVLMGEVTGVDKQSKRVLLSDGKGVPYDTLILAAGARYNYFGHEDWEDVSPGLKSIVDAGMIRSRLLEAFESAEKETNPEAQSKLLTFILVGGGPTGVELAGSLAELARGRFIADFKHIKSEMIRILVIEGGPRILAGFSEKLAKKALHELEKLGVQVMTRARVTCVDNDGVKIGEERIPAKTVIWTAGVRGTSVASWLNTPADSAGRVKVRPDCTIEGHPEIFVIGDVADFSHTPDGSRLPGVAEVAMQQGRFVGHVIRDRLRGKTPRSRFKYVDLGNLAVVGRGYAIAERSWIKLWGFPGWVVWAAVHIFFLIGFGHRVLVIAKWAWAYFTRKRGNLIITSTTYGRVAIRKETKTAAG